MKGGYIKKVSPNPPPLFRADTRISDFDTHTPPFSEEKDRPKNEGNVYFGGLTQVPSPAAMLLGGGGEDVCLKHGKGM